MKGCQRSERTCFEISVKSLRLINGESIEKWQEYCCIFVFFSRNFLTTLASNFNAIIFQLHYQHKISAIRSEHNADLITFKTGVSSEQDQLQMCTQAYSYNNCKTIIKVFLMTLTFLLPLHYI